MLCLKCDRCGKPFLPSNNDEKINDIKVYTHLKISNTMTINGDCLTNPVSFDLCNTCADKFDTFIKSGKYNIVEEE